MSLIIEEANKLALSKMQDAQPTWVDVKVAHKVLDGLDKYTILHAGPPIEFEKMCVPMQGGIIAALMYEGLAENEEEAIELLSLGKIKFSPCHHFHAVGPMTGIISYSMPLLVVKNETHGNYSYCTINEGKGDVVRFGAHTVNTIKRLKWIEEVLAPALKSTVKYYGGVNLKVIISQGLQMGDELHMRNAASSNLFIKTIIEGIAEVVEDKKTLNEIIKFLLDNDQFFLNFAMAASKACADAAHDIENSTIVTAMARNGVNIGIRVSGLGDRWFTAPAANVKGLYFPGYSEQDANRDIGDSAIMETAGVGGFAIAAAPSIVKFLGAGTYKDAINYTLDMYEINADESKHYRIPNLDFRGTPIGIDIMKVVETGIEPIINTAVVSNNAGGGMIGAGIARAPISMFEDALIAFAEKMGI